MSETNDELATLKARVAWLEAAMSGVTVTGKLDGAVRELCRAVDCCTTHKIDDDIVDGLVGLHRLVAARRRFALIEGMVTP